MRLPIDSQFIQSRMKQLSLTHKVLLELGLNRTTTDAISKGDDLHIDAIFRLAEKLRVNPVKLINPLHPDLQDDFLCSVTDSSASWDKTDSVLIGPSTSEEIKASYIASHHQYKEMQLKFLRDDILFCDGPDDEAKVLQMQSEVDLLRQVKFDSTTYKELLAPRIGWLSSLVPEQVILDSRDQLLGLEEELAKSLVDLEPLSNQVETLDAMLKKAERNADKASIQRRALDIESNDFNLLHFRIDRPTTISEQIFEPFQISEKNYQTDCQRYTFLIKPLVTTHLLILVPKTESFCLANIAKEGTRESIKQFIDEEAHTILVPRSLSTLYPESYEEWSDEESVR